MIKFFPTLFIILAACNFVLAQDGYIKFRTDTDYPNDTIKILKGEILPYAASAKGKIHIIAGKDTLKDVNFPSNQFDTISSPNLGYQEMKADLVKLKNGFIHLDATAISPSDTVTMISDTGKQVSQLITIRKARIKQEDGGQSFRLIITGAPTIFYQSENLKEFVPEPAPTIVGPEEPSSGWAWWQYLLVILLIGGIGLAVYIFLNSRKLKPNEARFSGGSLTEFANLYGGLNHLHQLNPDIIPSKSEWNNKSTIDKKTRIHQIKGKKIIVKAEEGFSFNKNEYKNENDFFETNVADYEVPVEPIQTDGNQDLHRMLMQMEKNLITEIKSTSSKVNESLHEINRLSSENLQLKSDKQKLSALNTEFENKIDAIIAENKKASTELHQIKEKILVADYLKSYAESCFAFLKYCEQVSADAYGLFNRISAKAPAKASSLGFLLVRFQTSTNNIPIGNWLQIVQDIKDTGATTNRQLIRSFAQIQSDDERLREFQRVFLSEVLTKYSSSMLILAEAFRNLEHFQVPAEWTSDMKNVFNKHVVEITNKAKATGLTLKYVPLFKNFEEYVGQIEAVDAEKSLAYREVNNLGKGAIAEIVSYGIKTSFEETKTRIILV